MGRVIELFVDQFLAIDQGVPETNPEGLFVTQVFAMTDTAKNYRSWHEAHNRLNMGQDIIVRHSIFQIEVVQYLPMYQKGGNGPELLTLTQFFGMTQEAKVVEFEQLADTISFTQSADVVLCKNATTTLVMTDEASCNVVRPITVVHTIIIGSSGAGYLFSEDFYSIDLPTLTGPNAPEFQ